ncbi:MAG: hypothetical protein ACYC1Z_03505 [Georgenia sp.]
MLTPTRPPRPRRTLAGHVLAALVQVAATPIYAVVALAARSQDRRVALTAALTRAEAAERRARVLTAHLTDTAVELATVTAMHDDRIASIRATVLIDVRALLGPVAAELVDQTFTDAIDTHPAAPAFAAEPAPAAPAPAPEPVAVADFKLRLDADHVEAEDGGIFGYGHLDETAHFTLADPATGAPHTASTPGAFPVWTVAP